MTILEEVGEEFERAIRLHAPMNSAHEGYAVILEELEELWEEVRKRQPQREKLRSEAIQLAAMAVRFILDVCET